MGEGIAKSVDTELMLMEPWMVTVMSELSGVNGLCVDSMSG
jgi:hypothetical protein